MDQRHSGKPAGKSSRASALGVSLAIGALAAGPAAGATYSVRSSIGLTETYSDNINLAAAGAKRSAWVTQILPNISINSTGGGRVKLNLTAGLDGAAYAGDGRSGAGSRTNLNLGADAKVEAVENFLFVDARAQVTQAGTSVVGARSFDNIHTAGNRAEVRTFSVSPYVRGMFRGNVAYELRHNFLTSDSDAQQLRSTRTSEWLLSVGQSNAFGPLGWGFNHSTRKTNLSARNAADTSSSVVSLTYAISPQLRVLVRGGRESNNFASRQDFTTRGVGFDWLPSERTSISGSRDERFFGSSYSLAFNHRMPMSAFSLSASRSISTAASLLLGNVPVALSAGQLAALGPNPSAAARRQVLLEAFPPALAGFIGSASDAATAQLLQNIFASMLLGTNFLVSTPFLTDRILISQGVQASFALRGVRNNVVLLASRSRTGSATSSGAGFTDDLQALGANAINANMFGVTFSHSLSPLTSLSVSATQTRTSADSAAANRSRHRLLNFGMTSALGARTSGSLNLRRADFDSTTTDYQENALIGTLNYAF